MMARHSQISHGAHRPARNSPSAAVFSASINQGFSGGAAMDRRGYRKKKSA